MVAAHFKSGVLNGSVNGTRNDPVRVQGRYRLGKEGCGFHLGLGGPLDDRGIGLVQHPFAEGVGKIIGKHLVTATDIQKTISGQDIKVRVLLGA